MTLLIAVTYVVLGGLVFILLAALTASRKNRCVEIRDTMLAPEELEKHAMELARNHPVGKTAKGLQWLIRRMNDNFSFISDVFKSLNEDVKALFPTAPAAEWLLDNFYIIEEQVKLIRRSLARGHYSRLPVLKKGYLKGYPRVYAIALELIAHTDGRIDEKALTGFINAYQSQVLLSMGELWAVALMLRIALIENTRYICEAVLKSQKEWHRAEKLTDILTARDFNELNTAEIINEQLTSADSLSPSFIEHLLQKLRKQGKSISTITYLLDRMLKEHNSSTDIETNLDHQMQASRQVSIGNTITGLKLVSDLDWADLFESLSQVESILRQDPAEIYKEMDFESRDYYRHEVEKLARAYNTSEINVAGKAVECAANALNAGISASTGKHVGYYIIGKGRKELSDRLARKLQGKGKLSSLTGKYSVMLYLSAIALFTFFLTSYFSYYANSNTVMHSAGWSVIAFVAALIPCSELAVTIINCILGHVFKPSRLPKLDLKYGITDNLATMVIMPTLLTGEKRVRDLLDQLEVYYLGNRDANLTFALVGDFRDSSQQTEQGDNDIINAALAGVRELNEKYCSGNGNIFFYMNRQRKFNSKQGKWMGWERKRGAIIEFIRLIKRSGESGFSVISCDIGELPKVKYVITLDADTCLPMGAAKKLVGTLAHPLNNAVVDRKKGIVIEGYGLLQPRISVSVSSSNYSLFTRIFAGQGGIDPYTTAISDIYQDIFKEGIFTGKGIFDLDVFMEVLDSRLPENTILSHDLIEGCHLRAGLVTDIELVDGYPSRYSSFSMRLHRWVRGDWQLLPWLVSKVRDGKGQISINPLSTLSRWKIIDNLRRSLVNPALFILLLLGAGVLPGSFFVWFGLALAATATPLLTGILNILLSGNVRTLKVKRKTTAVTGAKASIYQSILLFAFIPYQAWLMADAIFRTLVRVIFTRRNMLEWITAADMENILKNDVKSFVKRMWMCIAGALAIIALPLITGILEALALALPAAVLWIASPAVAWLVSKPAIHKKENITNDEMARLRRLARKTWRYFEDFAVKEDNYLPPDNYQEEPPKGAAHRTSPTNMGLLLLSVLSAYDMGYISLSEMCTSLDNIFGTIDRMEKWKGHLYNWYNTITLETMKPFYVSTVDSGNLLGYLIVLREGLKEYIRKPVPDLSAAQGLLDTVLLMKEERNLHVMDTDRLQRFIANGRMDLTEWNTIISGYSDDMDRKAEEGVLSGTYWEKRLSATIYSFQKELQDFYPAVVFQEDFSGLGDTDGETGNKLKSRSGLSGLADTYANILSRLEATRSGEKCETGRDVEKAVNHLNESRLKIESVIGHIRELTGRINCLIDNMQFTPLFDKKRQLFSIGFNVDDGHLSKSYYDLLASEARQASYIAIARGEADSKHWFRLGRKLASSDGFKGLISWTGTMFEYLMPLLIIRNFENTLFDETYAFVIHTQKRNGKHRKIPWGISESGFNAFDINLNYQYKAFGVPELGLKRGLGNDMVVSPYSCILAITLDPAGTAKNVAELEKMGMNGKYGLYESVDFTPSRLERNVHSSIVKSFMAHHQGMSIAALNNFFNDNILQRRFHSDPVIKSAELLLQEKSPESSFFAKEYRDDSTFTEKRIEAGEGEAVRTFGVPDSVLPHMHILSNGSYSVTITDGGSGYSKNEGKAVTRWSGDSAPEMGGMFVYIQNVNSNSSWSATFEPSNDIPEKYRVVFSPDKAEFHRKDGNIETYTEITVSPEDNAEVRRISLTNHSGHARVIEVTSYFEVVLSAAEDDAAHPAFSKLFISTEYERERACLLATRRQRTEGCKPVWLMHTMAVDGNVVGEIQYETDRMKFIGRNRSLAKPAAMEPDQPLSNSEGSVLDPVMSLRRRIRIEPGKTARIAFTVAVAQTRKFALELAEKYQDIKASERAFELSWTRSQVESRYLGLKSEDVELFLELAPFLLMYNPLRAEISDMIEKNTKAQPDLWPFGISGDLPLLLARITGREDMDIVFWVLKAHEYWRMKGLEIDLVIFIEQESGYSQPILDMVRDAVAASHARELAERKGGVFIKSASVMDADQIYLFYTTARFVVKGSINALKEQINQARKTPYLSLTGKTAEEGHGTLSQTALPAVPDVGKLDFFNGIGGFNTEGTEYIIKLQKNHTTPAPWINVISNPDFGFLVTESGGGYTWSDNSRENKLTAWSNDPVTDRLSEAIYLKDNEDGSFWSITPKPVREDGTYMVRHGFGYTVFRHDSHGMEQSMTLFAAGKDTLKFSLVSLKNISGAAREITLIYYVRPVLGVNGAATWPYVVSGFREESRVLLMENKYANDSRGKIAFIYSSEEYCSYTGDRNEFFGINGSMEQPAAMYADKFSGRVGAGLDPCAAVKVGIKLEAGEEKQVVFLFGQSGSIREVETIVNRYRSPDSAADELEKVRNMWAEKLSVMQVDTPDKSMDVMLNGWLLYQVISCRLWARSAFYQAGGAFGFRDQLQDCMAVMNIWPDLAKKQLLLHASRQFVEGDVQHWWHNEHGKGIRTKYSDDLLWLPYVAAEYVDHTGDRGILDTEIPFIDSEKLAADEDERYDIPWISRETGTLYQHCIRSIDLSLRFGVHGIPLMGSGDWNDGMNAVGNKGRGESVWLGWFLYTVLKKFIPISVECNDKKRAERYTEAASNIVQFLEREAWDGSWYRRAYFDDGTPLGSVQNSECRIDSISQSWAVISGAGKPERVKEAMDAVEKYLIDREEGVIKLLTPPFDKGILQPGYIKGYVPGVRENGGQYTHAASWTVMAFAELGAGDKAWELFHMINPVNHARTEIEYARYKVEPYVMSADVYAVAPNAGRGGWSWYTGSAGWIYNVGVENILGIRKRGNLLYFDPCIPEGWNGYRARYRFCSTTYDIKVENPQGVSKGVLEVTSDLGICPDNAASLVDDGREHSIVVVMGKGKQPVNAD
ncbi:MAG: glycosyl transferase [Ruminiclostridium sp.]|nr:glycosyl transferase [Ruminiclostridium sp.]